ncbi:hypothetical protein HDU80_008934 [Chytriomyces hyalinus]|nr:hypothetical protein HDU80_008934 [Chytriomyces hyalinus]
MTAPAPSASFQLLPILLYPGILLVSLLRRFLSWPHDYAFVFTPPSKTLIRMATAPFLFMFPTKIKNLEVVHKHKRRKIMFVGNHLIGGMDLAFTMPLIYLNTGVYPRGVADILHYRFPFWAHGITLFGGVNGSRENCNIIMKAGEPLMLLPGGINEVLKDDRMDKYTLIWKDRVGFIKLAIEHGYTIIPFGIVGLEDMVSIAFSIPSGLFFWLMGDTRGLAAAPAANMKMQHPTSKPMPFPDIRIPILYPWLSFQTSYLVFGDPIDCAGDFVDKESVYALRNQVRDSVEGCIKSGQRMQSVDPRRYRKTFGQWF